MFKSEIIPGFNPRNEFKHKVMDKIVDHYANIELEGETHLDTTREILQEHDVTVFPNHESNLDAPIWSRILDLSGNQDLEERTAYALGIKLVRNRLTRHVTDAYDHITVVPKGYEPETEEEAQEIREKQVNRKALEALKAARRDHRMIVLFAEGTRSRTGKMQQGIPEAANYVIPNRDRKSYVLPVGLEGSFEMYPPGQVIPRKGDVFVRVGEPIDVSTIEAPSGKDKKQGIVDRLMTEVARLLPEDKRGFYASYVV